MKNILYSILISLLFVFASCEKSSDDMSKVTYFVSLELKGAEKMIIKKGEAYVEPGFVAEMQGKDVSSSVVVKGSVNTNAAGSYTIVYSAANEDGFAKSLTRTVYVSDPAASVIESGIYTVSEGSKRTLPSVKAFSGYEVIVYQTEPGVFYISDFLGGWYDKGSNYGSDFAMVGHFQLNSDNTLTALDSSVAGWGDSMDELTNASVDPATGIIKWTVAYAGTLSFDIIINK